MKVVVSWIIALQLALQGPTHASEAKYNVLFVLVDDLKPTIGAFGDDIADTPVMDAMFSKGIRFDNANSQKSECAPSRISMLTGHRNDELRMWGFREKFRRSDYHPTMHTLPSWLRTQGFRAEAIGKVFDNRYFTDNNIADNCTNSNMEPFCSFDHVVIPRMIWDGEDNVRCEGETAMRWPTENESIDQSKANKNQALVWEIDNGLAHKHIDYCISLLAQERLRILAKGTKPFFLSVGFAKPHMAWIATKDDFDVFRQVPDHMLEPPPLLTTGSDIVDDADFWSDHNAMTRVDDNNELKSYNGWETVSFPDRSRGYYASTRFVDEQLGHLLRVLEEETSQQVRDNTMVIFWGDHGFHLGDHNLWGKKTVLEQATRVPLGIVPPKAFLDQNEDIASNLGSNYGTTAPVDSVDIFPTILDMMGLSLPSTLAGTSLVPLMRDPNTSVRTASVSQYEAYRSGLMGYSIRTKYHRLIVYLRTDSNGFIQSISNIDGAQLYRYLQPGNYETVDHHADPAFKAIYDEMLKIMEDPSGRNNIPDRDWTHLYTADNTIPFDNDMSFL